jgi:hypothetical protein
MDRSCTVVISWRSEPFDSAATAFSTNRFREACWFCSGTVNHPHPIRVDHEANSAVSSAFGVETLRDLGPLNPLDYQIDLRVRLLEGDLLRRQTMFRDGRDTHELAFFGGDGARVAINAGMRGGRPRDWRGPRFG